MTTYFKNKEKASCYGCSACKYVCPTNAIEMVEDEEGFFYPKIDNNKCIKCNLCSNKCIKAKNILRTDKNLDRRQAYAAYTKNLETRQNSTSGGMFTVISNYVLEKNGVIYGVEFDENFKVKYSRATSKEETVKFRGSKYIRSRIDDVYDNIKEDLNNSKVVLFIGVPCQIAGLYASLSNKKYDNLITVELICHSTPPQKVFDKYLQYLEKKEKDKISTVRFRSRINGWRVSGLKIEFQSGKAYYDKMYMRAFSRGSISRPSCYECEYADYTKRVADITIGDCWGVENYSNILDDNTGISIVIISSVIGKEIFENIKDDIIYKKINMKTALSYNHNKPIKMHENRDKFFANLENLEFDKLHELYCLHKDTD